METPFVIIGAGGFGREVHDVMEAVNDGRSTAGKDAFDFLGFIDDGQPDAELLAERGAQRLGGTSELANLPANTRFVIAIGDGATRRKLDKFATGLGLEAATLIHPAATMGRHRVEIGPGSVICSHVSLTTNIRLGRHVHLNLNCTVGHDATLGDYVTVFPGATISGDVTLESEVMIGTGAAVIQGITIGHGSVIGASAAVTRDIPAGVTAVGVPARQR